MGREFHDDHFQMLAQIRFSPSAWGNDLVVMFLFNSDDIPLKCGGPVAAAESLALVALPANESAFIPMTPRAVQSVSVNYKDLAAGF